MSFSLIKTKNSLNPAINIGVSGCKIVFQDNKVLKVSGSPYYDSRLIKQAQKQNLFLKNFQIPGVKAPFIYDVTSNSFTMERIRGLSWLDYLNQASIKDIDNLISTFITYLNFLKGISSPYELEEQNNLILRKLQALYPLTKYKTLNKDLQGLIIKNKEIAPRSFCHGDLIFFNMMFSEGNVYFIDFLDSYVDSCWTDLIKLRQDLKYYYCLYHTKNLNNLRLRIIFNYINKELAAIFPEVNNNLFAILEKISILRIEPYCPEDKKWIIKEMLTKC